MDELQKYAAHIGDDNTWLGVGDSLDLQLYFVEGKAVVGFWPVNSDGSTLVDGEPIAQLTESI